MILLEKVETMEAAKENDIAFVYVDKESDVKELLQAIKSPERFKTKLSATVIQQRDIPVDRTWLGLMFGLSDVEKAFSGMTPIGDLFEISRGTIEYSASKSRGLGANQFFYYEKDRVKQWGIESYSVPVVTSPRYTKFFTFSHKDWAKTRDKGTASYLLLCREPKSKLSAGIKDYIEWGEKECKVWYDKERFAFASQTQACKEREQDRSKFAGWYDVGGVRDAAFFTGYYSQYSHRFILIEKKMALDADFIAFNPRTSLTKEEVKAILAIMNSSIIQFQIEQRGRTTGGGMISVEVNYASELRIPDIRKLNGKQIARLASLFDELEEKARLEGGANKRENMEKLRPVIEKIDIEIAKIARLPTSAADKIRRTSDLLRERRITRAEAARPESFSGDEAPRIRPPKRASRKEDLLTHPLDRWT